MSNLNAFRSLVPGLIFLCSAIQVSAQTKYQKIGIFTKVWGFLKYYHPGVASGKNNWDSVFISNAKNIGSAGSIAEFNDQILALLEAAGPVEKISAKPAPDSLCAYNKINNDWIKQSKWLSDQVKGRLEFIYENKNQGDNKYIKIVGQTADFSGENHYENLGFPDSTYRLLFLARFWNIINYFAPYKYLTDDWDTVLGKFIPRIIHSDDSLSYYKTLLELSKSLHDGHAGVILSGHPGLIQDLIFGGYRVPFYYEIFDGKIFIRKPENDAIEKGFNLRRGDIILKMNNEDVKNLIDDRRKYMPASNEVGQDHFLSWNLLDGQAPSARLTIKRGTHIFNTTVPTILSSKRDWGVQTNYTFNNAGYKKLDDSLLVIYAAQIWKGNLDTLKYMINQAKAVIFDVRNYPQNDAFIYISDPFLSRPEIINYSSIAIPDFPGLFQWKPSPEIGHTNDHAYKGKVVILADERTQSQGEYSCMVLQTIPGAVTIGSQTAGTDGVLTSIPIGGELNISYSGYGIYYPDKRPTQGTGIKIDIPVKKTVESVTGDQDPIMDAALKYLRVKH